ncbi:MAG: helix-turn-helix domain-containing protein [Lachnospiraceae bacterium]|nr:helix-turn-helix domain-containing protein [Lachnospiraceae bacterium]
MLFTPNMIAGWMKKYLLCMKTGAAYPECSGGIEFIDVSRPIERSDILYIGEPDVICSVIEGQSFASMPLIILSSGETPKLLSLELPDNITLICFDLDIFVLYNKIHHYVHEFNVWLDSIHRELYNNNSLQALLDTANIHMKVSMAILNAGYRGLALSESPGIDDPFLREIRETGMVSFETVKYISDDLRSQGKDLEKVGHVGYLAGHSGLYSYIWDISYTGNVVARLIVVLPQKEPSPMYHDLCRILIEQIREYYLSSKSVNYGQNQLFGSLVADIIEGRIHDDATLNERLKPIKLAFNKYYHLLIVRFPDALSTTEVSPDGVTGRFTHLPWNYIISQFEQLFPFSNITTYQREIIILLRKNNYTPRLHLNNMDEIDALLQYYNGYLMVGNFSKFLSSLGSIYHSTEDTFELALKINRTSGQRILYYEDYSIYQSIEMSAAGMFSKHGMLNPVYLCPPSLISLYRYDRKYSTNLCEILKTYLNCDRNAAETARELYMHRNTMLYNIQKIEKILGQSLDDNMLRMRLLYGFYVIEYTEDILGEPLLNLKPNRTKAE